MSFCWKNPYQISVESGTVSVSYCFDFFQPAFTKVSVVNVPDGRTIFGDSAELLFDSESFDGLSEPQATTKLASSSGMSINERDLGMPIS